MSDKFRSWGCFPQIEQKGRHINWSDEGIPDGNETLLPYGLGRSYGDSCLNSDGLVLATRNLNRFLAFDEENGILKCEAGTSLSEIIELVLPKGWFLAVSPGTKFVTVGGAIANDVHGKNHHRDGTFGHHVSCFELLRSSGERLICSSEENQEMFRATIGGLGLTGLITWAEIQLKPVSSAYLNVETIRYNNIRDFKALSDESSSTHLYTVAWIDCQSKGKNLGRGLFMRANHEKESGSHGKTIHQVATCKAINVPFVFPKGVLNKFTVSSFNQLYFRKQLFARKQSLDHYDSFFYPLDSIANWNRIYGPKGFFQYQFLVPHKDYTAIQEALEVIAKSGAGSFLAVLKEFGEKPSIGMISFPRAGVCLALDFPNQGEKTLNLLERLDNLVVSAGGTVYPAKDARMSAESFKAYYSNNERFSKFIDPRFNSNFWRRTHPDIQ
jgi:FAD/FMN-containing dehydrogenase